MLVYVYVYVVVYVYVYAWVYVDMYILLREVQYPGLHIQAVEKVVWQAFDWSLLCIYVDMLNAYLYQSSMFLLVYI